ncbi:MAG: hypothetical protein KC910_31950 [Candidatus Eremiobacteraeota bacterium]|nr:hypothetical protein [Candidatus Eremiobacteraeota bacterium]
MRRSDRGISLLLEIVFGLGIFAVALLLVFGVFVTTRRSSTQARNYSLALHEARNTLEQEASKAYASVVAIPAPGNLVTVPTLVNGQPGKVVFNVTTEVNETIPGERKEVRVTVAWSEEGIDRKVELETYVVNP